MFCDVGRRGLRVGVGERRWVDLWRRAARDGEELRVRRVK